MQTYSGNTAPCADENYKLLHTAAQPTLIMSAFLSAAETSDGLYAPIPGFQQPWPSNNQYQAVYDYEAQVSSTVFTSACQKCLLLTPTYVVLNASLSPCLEGGWALCVLRGCCRCHRWRWGRLVDGSKKWLVRIGSRLLPRQRMSSPLLLGSSLLQSRKSLKGQGGQLNTSITVFLPLTCRAICSFGFYFCWYH